MTAYIGIDPGVSGAIAAILEDGSVRFFDMPVCKVKSGKGAKSEYDASALASILQLHGMYCRTHATIERQQSMPGQGVASTFKTGFGFGLLVGALAGLKLPYTVVSAVTWKRRMMDGMGKEKGASILRAKQLFPQAASELHLKKHHGRADALLIAAYGRHLEPGD
jgi:hypothetical protein